MSGLRRYHWNILPPANSPELLASGFPPLICQLLYNRGLTRPSEFELFFAADNRLDGDPFMLPDMHQAIGRIYQALLSDEKVAVYGDFDVDGVTGTAVLVEGLKALGARVTPFIPNRFTDGYGLKSSVLEDLRRQGHTLVVSVDCGVTAIPEVRKARRLGMDVVVTDHHLPREALPEAVAVVDPRRADSTYHFSDLAGVGVAYKLLQALNLSLGKKLESDELLELVALGTIADMVPLLGENRFLAREGITRLNATKRAGLRSIMARNNISPGNLDASRISWVIAPRLNTPGRLEHAFASYTLLTTASQAEAEELTVWLEQKNTERQRLTSNAIIRAREQVQAAVLPPILIAGDGEYPVGIAGLVANRLAEEFYRPCVIIRTGEAYCSGSCRSIPEFNIAEALSRCSHLLTRFGGHARAAGFALPARNLNTFRKALLEIAAEQLAGVELQPRLDIETTAALPELVNAFPQIQKFSPFGQGNPEPAFLTRRVQVVDCRTMGSRSEHLRLKVKQNGMLWDAVGFDFGSLAANMPPYLDIVFNLEMDHWNGNERLRLNLLDLDAAQ